MANDPVIIYFYHPFKGDEVQHLTDCIENLVPGSQYTLVPVEIKEWGREMSPWPATDIDETFAGGGQETMARLRNEILPTYSGRKIYLTGYSMAGLFALWAALEDEDGTIAGASCCSGSLWYPGFTDYVKSKAVSPAKAFYISLGGKEEKTKDPLMAQIGSCTREIVAQLKSQARTEFEMNSGGHFADSGKRLAKGVKWVIDN